MVCGTIGHLGKFSRAQASILVSLNSILTKKITEDVRLYNNSLLFYKSVNTSMLFVPLVAVFEYPILMSHCDKLADAIFWAGAGFSGFGVLYWFSDGPASHRDKSADS